jgi:hypothetical protein
LSAAATAAAACLVSYWQAAMPDLRGKTAIVTGATSGIGEVCARELAGMGATVVLAGRSQQKLQATLARIKQKYPDADVAAGPLIDFGDPTSIRGFAAEFKRQGRPLHILVNNAGAYTTTKHRTKEGVAELCQVRPHCAMLWLHSREPRCAVLCDHSGGLQQSPHCARPSGTHGTHVATAAPAAQFPAATITACHRSLLPCILCR